MWIEVAPPDKPDDEADADEADEESSFSRTNYVKDFTGTVAD
jgi:hypothetical protein